jgi:dynein heavy chain
MLERMKVSLNIVEATNQKGVHEELSKIKTMLAICEKALQEYLETKRLVFPRFYFLSQTDLLDILSNGNQPHIAQKYVRANKYFSSYARILFPSPGLRKQSISPGFFS